MKMEPFFCSPPCSHSLLCLFWQDTGLTFSLIWTSAANALLLLHLNPLWCAVLGRVFLGDKLPRRTIIALVAAIGCMMLIFVPDIVDRSNNNNNGDSEEELQSATTSTKGNVTACFTGIMLAVYIAIIRKAGLKNSNDNDDNNNNNDTVHDSSTNAADRENENESKKEINLVGSTSLSALLSSMIALIIRRGNVLPDSSWRGGEEQQGGDGGEVEGQQGGELWQFWLAMVADGLALGIIFVSLTIAPRLAKGAEVALVLLLEVVLGPLWVFLAYRDVPSVWTLVGGSMYVYRSVPVHIYMITN
jgi:drug/metabolite transporter (DMT)-like permease